METGRKKTVDTRHTFTQFGDWSRPSRPLSSAFAKGTVVWVPNCRGLAFQNFPVWVRTSWPNPRPRPSVQPKICRETSANMAAGGWSGDQAVGLGGRPLPDGWICGINRTEDLTCMAVDRWRRRRRTDYIETLKCWLVFSHLLTSFWIKYYDSHFWTWICPEWSWRKVAGAQEMRCSTLIVL